MVLHLRIWRQVQEHIVSLIDTISFSIAARSRTGESAISPVLKQTAPSGSVEVKQVAHRPALRPETLTRHNEISTVARAQAFQTATEKLSVASKRLENESQRQSQYWEQMALLQNNGWPLSRLPQNDRALVLHLASGEAGRQYQNRGIAMLQQEDSGNLVLPGQVDSRQQKVISVTVERQGQVTGRFVHTKPSESLQQQVEADLIRAKESLFQEELFNEIAREAHLVANMGVKARSAHVEIELSPECTIHIRHTVGSQPAISVNDADQCLAEYIGMGLRMLLIAEYQHKNLIRSTLPPQPLSTFSRPPAEYAILRPLLAQLRHETTISKFLEQLTIYQATLKRAGFALSCEHTEKTDGMSNTSMAFQDLRKVISSSLIINLPSGSTKVIDVETHLGAPLFGTSFLPATYTNTCGTIACAQTSAVQDVVSFIQDVLAQEIASVALHLTEEASTWSLHSQFPLEFEADGQRDRETNLTIKCDNGSVSMVFRRVGEGPSKVVYSASSSQVSSAGALKDTDLELTEVVNQWLESQ